MTRNDQMKASLEKVKVGSRIDFRWVDWYYKGTIASRKKEQGPHCYEIHFDDGEIHTIDLSKEQFHILTDDG